MSAQNSLRTRWSWDGVVLQFLAKVHVQGCNQGVRPKEGCCWSKRRFWGGAPWGAVPSCDVQPTPIEYSSVPTTDTTS
eukprot:1160414-Pelagomonas_calceolata.AAC.3